MKPIIIESEEQLLEHKGKPLTPEEEAEYNLYLIEKWTDCKIYCVRVSGDSDYEETINSNKEDS